MLPNTEQDSVRAAELILAAGRSSERRVLSLGDGLCLALAERLGLPAPAGTPPGRPSSCE